jgi:hypothetical protein
MRALAAPVIAELNKAELTIVQLIVMQFPSLTVALNSSNRDVFFDGVTYLGAAGLGKISEIEDSPGEIKGLQFEMSGVPTNNIALALSESNVVQGAVTVIRLAILNSAGQVLDAPIDWSGRLDTMTIQEDGGTCSIGATAESSAVDLLRGNSLTTSNADQQFLYPGDRAFEYVVSQASQPVVWPTKQLFMAMR